MAKENLQTSYAPAVRSSVEEMTRQYEIFSRNRLLINLVESLSQILVVLNKNRQIIYANDLYYEFCGIQDKSLVLGKRIGEVLKCTYSEVSEGGCGTSEFCRKCGAANAILESSRGIKTTHEFKFLSQTIESKELQVTATLYDYENEPFTLFVLKDISDSKRKETLERIFFHDILNSAGGISGLSSILKEIDDPDEISEIADTINHAAENLIEEIQTQRQINAAESGELKPDFKEISSDSICDDVKNLYSRQMLASTKSLVTAENFMNVKFTTDPVLVRRILGNMVKNALEVYNPRATITINCQHVNNTVCFSVNNPKYMERDVQLQVFKRSFSTKGIGRGLGTYSMKLLGERYLKGKVFFKSEVDKGTTFYIELPLVPGQ